MLADSFEDEIVAGDISTEDPPEVELEVELEEEEGKWTREIEGERIIDDGLCPIRAALIKSGAADGTLRERLRAMITASGTP